MDSITLPAGTSTPVRYQDGATEYVIVGRRLYQRTPKMRHLWNMWMEPKIIPRSIAKMFGRSLPTIDIVVTQGPEDHAPAL